MAGGGGALGCAKPCGVACGVALAGCLQLLLGDGPLRWPGLRTVYQPQQLLQPAAAASRRGRHSAGTGKELGAAINRWVWEASELASWKRHCKAL